MAIKCMKIKLYFGLTETLESIYLNLGNMKMKLHILLNEIR